ncbi:alpha/beta hydrolase [Alpinimonas psychrophila]|uniref:Alpha-beta hydrolase superfamily lysophospholipase n=1 Tax=Alpinimonas psychrophila TaxID=748908 RepID=A0A7W3JUI0_9MICO|nr:alpha/beta hydrolase [Alpinimonas psychrophila]MBA8829499.1 alpha-beta hydrolase superfamily lysophospholipase [Alpinimonas psychrophila]
MSQDWVADTLGDGFEQLTLPLKSDSEGEVVATLVRYLPQPESWSRRGFWQRLGFAAPDGTIAHNTDVIYIHGYSDYFFQAHLAEYWRSLGARFYALDLRKYGRSIRPHQTPGYIDRLATYDEDIEAALTRMGHGEGQSPTRKLVLMGHSTGGLVLSLWATRNPGRMSAVVLNSPWLEYQLTAAARTMAAPVVGFQARMNPMAPMANIDRGFYVRSIWDKREGEWDFNIDWRPEHGFTVRTGWLNAILAGHARIAAGLDIDVPIFTLLSTKSLLTPRWSKDMMQADVAIDVNIVAARVHQLGKLTTVARIPNALHDVFLSEKSARERAFRELTRWLKAYL